MKEEDFSVSYCYTAAEDLVFFFFWLYFAVVTAVLDGGEETTKDIVTFITTLLSLVTAVYKFNAKGAKLDLRAKTIYFLPDKKKPKNLSDIKKIVHCVRKKGRDEVKVYINNSASKDFMISKEDYKDFASRISRLNPDVEFIDQPYESDWC